MMYVIINPIFILPINIDRQLDVWSFPFTFMLLLKFPPNWLTPVAVNTTPIANIRFIKNIQNLYFGTSTCHSLFNNLIV